MLREIDDLKPVVTSDGFFDNISWGFWVGGGTKEPTPVKTAENSTVNWTTIGILVVLAFVLFLLFRK